MKKKISYTTGIFLIGLSAALLYTAPIKTWRTIGITSGIIGSFLVGLTVDLSTIRGGKD